MSARLEAAQTLANDIRHALDEAGLTDVPVTLEARKLSTAALVKHGGVLVTAPRIEWPTFGTDTDLTWTVVVAAGPPDRELTAWERIDTIIDALIDSFLPITHADPGQIRPADGPAVPAYELTVTS